jgi:hypothetical protein
MKFIYETIKTKEKLTIIIINTILIISLVTGLLLLLEY